MPPRRIAVVVAALLVVASCSRSGEATWFPPTTATTTTTVAAVATSSTTSTTLGGFVPAPASFTSCGARLQCATVTVPLDYDDPTGPTIDLSINKLPARNPAERIGVLLMNPGGPGGSGFDFVAGGVSLNRAIQDRFDIIGFDPRGVGRSTPLQCGTNDVAAFQTLDSAPDDPDEQAQLDAAAQAIADDCARTAGELLPHLGTDDVVRDIDTIRQALGEAQINYLGVSYGTLLGLRYAELFPQNARAIAIDGVVDPAQPFTTFLRKQTIAFEVETSRFLDACPTGGQGCPPGGAAAAYDQLAQEVETAPVRGNRGTLGPSELAVALLIPTYEIGTRTLFYQGLTSALQGDASTLLQIAESYYNSVDFSLYVAVECIDSPHPVGAVAYQQFAADLRGLSPRLGGAIANELLPCAFWPAPVQDITGPVVAASAPPILVIGNTEDAATPYEQAVAVASTLAHGRLLTFESGGHGAYGSSDCVADVEDAYFIDLTLPGEGTTCQN